MKKILGVLLVSAVSLISANAAVLTETEVFSFTPNGSEALNFNQFDSALGTLTGITITFSLSKTGGSLQADNDSAVSGSITLEHILRGGISSTDVSLINGSFAPIGAQVDAVSSFSSSVGGTTGDSTTQFDNTGFADYVSFNPGVDSNSASDSVNQFAWGSGNKGYLGTGTFNINVALTQLSNISGVGGVNYALVNSLGSGEVTVAYTYTAVPEPQTVVLSIAGLMAVLFFARRRRSVSVS